jgi:hypothetical protein
LNACSDTSMQKFRRPTCSGRMLGSFRQPSRQREALYDRCAPTHATTKVAARRPTYWSERQTTGKES